jgi:hypothetical protein
MFLWTLYVGLERKLEAFEIISGWSDLVDQVWSAGR